MENLVVTILPEDFKNAPLGYHMGHWEKAVCSGMHLQGYFLHHKSMLVLGA